MEAAEGSVSCTQLHIWRIKCLTVALPHSTQLVDWLTGQLELICCGWEQRRQKSAGESAFRKKKSAVVQFLTANLFAPTVKGTLNF